MKGGTMTTGVLHGGPLDGLEVELDEITQGIVLGAAVFSGAIDGGEAFVPTFGPTNPGDAGVQVCFYSLFRIASESDLAFYLYEEGRRA